MTGMSDSTISEHYQKFCIACDLYLDDYFDNNKLGKDLKIIEMDAMWFGKNKKAAGINKGAYRKGRGVWGIKERHGRVRCWPVIGEKREFWQPVFERFVDFKNAACVCTDDAKTYMYIKNKYLILNPRVKHNVQFVRKGHLLQFERHKKYVRLKVHTNSVEGYWGNIKMWLYAKHGVGDNLSGLCHYYSFLSTFRDDLQERVADMLRNFFWCAD